MKKIFNYCLLGLGILLFFSCKSAKKQSEIPVVDVTKSYPRKEIVLQDIADVEYIPLETRDDVLLGSCRFIPMGKDKFLAYDLRGGDIFVFSSKGKFISKFNHKGQAGNEYVYISKIIVDEAKQELLILDFNRGDSKRIQVFDFEGVYKRTVTYDKELNITNSADFNDSQILCYHNPEVDFKTRAYRDEKIPKLLLLSKETGNVDSIFQLPITKNVNKFCWFKVGERIAFIVRTPEMIVSSKNGFIINEIACDTIYEINRDKKLMPLLVRSPKVTPTDSPQKMLGITATTSEAYYLEVILKQYDSKTRKGFDKTTYLLQKSDNQIFEYSLKNNDIAEPERVVTLSEVSQFLVEDLKELLEEGKLSGKLKEIAEKLSPDDNPVLVKVKFKE